MLTRRPLLWLAPVVLILLISGCSRADEPAGTLVPAEATPEQASEPEPTPLPEITIVEREQLVVGVDAAFPPFVDLNRDGEYIGIEVDLFAAIADLAGLDYQLQSADWDAVFDDLISGRFNMVFGGLVQDNAPAALVELTEPYFELGQVAVTRGNREDITALEDLAGATVGVVPLSWGEYAVTGQSSSLPGGYQVPPGNIRHYDTAEKLVEALFADYVDVIVTDHTVIESFLAVNPDDMRVLRPRGQEGEGAGSDAWLAAHRFHIAVPKGADELLASLNAAIEQARSEGQIAAVMEGWGFVPEFVERPRFVQDAGASSLIAGVEKVDDMTVRFVLNRPDPNFDYKMAVPAMAIHSPANLELYAGGDLGLNPVGTGPYGLAGWEPGQALTLTASPSYWGVAPLIDTILVRTVPDAAERFRLLKAGEVQLVDSLGPEDLAALEEEEDEKIVVYPRAPVNIAYLGMNRDTAPFDERLVRLAVATCIDQPALVETVYPTGTLVAHQFVPPNTFGFSPGLLWYDQDSEGAAALLADAGYSAELALTLSFANVPSDYLPEPRLIAEAIRGQLGACGITTTLESLDADTYVERLEAGELPLHLGGWSADYPGPISFLNTHFTGVGTGLQFGAPFPEVVERLEQAAESSDRTLRQELYNQVNQLLKEKVVFVPLAHGSSALAARSTLNGVVTNPVRRESLTRVGPFTDTATITTFVYAVRSDPLSLDPTDEWDDATFEITSQVYDTLVDFEPATTVLTQGLAIEWSSNESYDVWEFTLRPGVRFQDGTPLTADAVIVNFERLWDPEHPWRNGRTGAFRYFRALFGGFKEPQGRQ